MSTELTINDVHEQAEYVDKALTLAGKMVTDGEICGQLTVTDGDTWSITHYRGYTQALTFATDAQLSHLTHSPESEIKTAHGLKVRPLANLQAGVTLTKITDLV